MWAFEEAVFVQFQAKQCNTRIGISIRHGVLPIERGCPDQVTAPGGEIKSAARILIAKMRLPPWLTSHPQRMWCPFAVPSLVGPIPGQGAIDCRTFSDGDREPGICTWPGLCGAVPRLHSQSTPLHCRFVVNPHVFFLFTEEGPSGPAFYHPTTNGRQ